VNDLKSYVVSATGASMRYCSPVVPVSTTTFCRSNASRRVGNGLDDGFDDGGGIVGSAEIPDIAGTELGLGDGVIPSCGPRWIPSFSWMV
jgi:hypothetical protein